MDEQDWDEEERAAQVAASVLHATGVVPRDIPGAPDGTHDFDILDGERIIALEVTVATDQKTHEFWAAVEDQDWEELSIEKSWGLIVKPGVMIKPLRRKIAGLLQQLEAVGVRSFDESPTPRSWGPEVGEAIAALHAEGVRQAIATDTARSRWITVGMVGPGNWSSNNDLNGAVQAVIGPNIQKLRSAEADERHLFVWLDPFSDKAQASVHYILMTGLLPSEPPSLPDGLDTVWVAPTGLVRDERLLLKATRESWERVPWPEEC